MLKTNIGLQRELEGRSSVMIHGPKVTTPLDHQRRWSAAAQAKATATELKPRITIMESTLNMEKVIFQNLSSKRT